MTVAELIAALSSFDPEMPVYFADTHGRDEGWGEGYEHSACEIGEVHVDSYHNAVVIEELVD